MNTSSLVKLLVGILVLAIAVYSLMGVEESFEEQVAMERQQYEKELKFMEDSPLLGKEGKLVFFDYNPNWKVKGSFAAIEGSARTFTLTMTDSTYEQIEIAGQFQFDKAGTQVHLLLFDEGESYLLPFVDATSGSESYGGGRYINVPKSAVEDGEITVDFNEAHNFYCAYSSDFVCPIPPVENTIKLPVNAGEMNYKQP